MTLRLMVLLAAMAVVSGCQRSPGLPAFADGSSTPNLSITPDQRMILSWTEPAAEGHALRLAIHDGRAWGATLTAATGKDWFVNWADFPSVIALPNGDLVAHWLQREGPDTYAYGVRIVRSRDGGGSWSQPVTPHRDGTLTEHGFVSLYAAGESDLGAVWLDGRNMSEGGPMSLRAAVLRADGSVMDERQLDERTCDCCQTAVANTANSPVVVYRDRGVDETRDMSVVRGTGDGWTAPVALHHDDWVIAACPVNGPAIASTASGLAVAWFTAPEDQAEVRVAFSTDQGVSFGAPIRIDEGLPLGRVHVAALDGGDILVSWLEDSASGAAIMLKRVDSAGGQSAAVVAAETASARASGFPRIAVRENEVTLAWTDPEPPGRVRVKTLAVPD